MAKLNVQIISSNSSDGLSEDLQDFLMELETSIHILEDIQFSTSHSIAAYPDVEDGYSPHVTSSRFSAMVLYKTL